jgi:hypothetical protein
MQPHSEEDLPRDVWPPPVSTQPLEAPSEIQYKQSLHGLKQGGMGAFGGIISGLVLSVLSFAIRIVFAWHKHNFYPYIYYLPIVVEIAVTLLIIVRRKFMAIGFALGAISISSFIAIVLTITDGIDTLD